MNPPICYLCAEHGWARWKELYGAEGQYKAQLKQCLTGGTPEARDR
jgi:hypothetical protein